MAIADGGFHFGHALFGNTTCEMLHLVCAFPGFQTYNVLINPNHPDAAKITAKKVRKWLYDSRMIK